MSLCAVPSPSRSHSPYHPKPFSWPQPLPPPDPTSKREQAVRSTASLLSRDLRMEAENLSRGRTEIPALSCPLELHSPLSLLLKHRQGVQEHKVMQSSPLEMSACAPRLFASEPGHGPHTTHCHQKCSGYRLPEPPWPWPDWNGEQPVHLREKTGGYHPRWGRMIELLTVGNRTHRKLLLENGAWKLFIRKPEWAQSWRWPWAGCGDSTRHQEKVIMIYAAHTSGEPAKRRDKLKPWRPFGNKILTDFSLEELLTTYGWFHSCKNQHIK